MILENLSSSNDNNCLIVAATENKDLIASLTAVKQLNISYYIVGGVAEMNEVSKLNPSVLGIIIPTEFLGANASDALGKIKEAIPRIPIILAASETRADFEKSARLMGIFYYLLAPYDREEFLNIVYALQCLKMKRAHDT